MDELLHAADEARAAVRRIPIHRCPRGSRRDGERGGGGRIMENWGRRDLGERWTEIQCNPTASASHNDHERTHRTGQGKK